MASWADSIPPSPIDLDAIPFFGADPAWTPAREEKMADAPDKAIGQCRLCGGDHVSEIPPGSRRVCMRCMRSGRDQYSLGARCKRPRVVPKIEPGYVGRDGVSVPERYARFLYGG